MKSVLPSIGVRVPSGLLSIGCDPSSDLLIDLKGRPVWPAHDESERAALASVAKLFNSGIHEVASVPGMSSQRRGTVVAVGPDAVHAARLYAHLTERRLQTINSVSDLRRTRFPEVVVTTLHRLTAELMETLYQADSFTPGIIVAENVSTLRRQVLIRSAAAVLCRRPRPAIVPSAMISAIDFRLLDPRTNCEIPSQDVRAKLGRGSTVLTLATHSDGIDAFLGELALCPLGGRATDRGPKRLPACISSDFCHRLELPLDAARRSGRLLPGDDVAARVVVFATCYGVLVSGSPVDSAWGLALSLLNNARIGALVTTWELNLVDVDPLKELQRQLEVGVPIGRAVAEFNRNDAVRGRGCRLSLFGDPSLRVGSTANKLRPTSKAHAAQEQHEDPSDCEPLDDVSFLRAYLEMAAMEPIIHQVTTREEGITDPNLRSALEALKAVKTYGKAKAERRPPKRLLALEHKMHSSVLLDLFARGKIVSSWIPYLRDSHISWTLARCWGCRGPARTAVVALGIPGSASRRLLFCPRCGLVEDVASHVNIQFRLNLKRREIRLSGKLPVRRWQAAVQLQSSTITSCRNWPWPSTNEGFPERTWRSPVDWMPGPFRVCVVMVHRGSVDTISREVYIS